MDTKPFTQPDTIVIRRLPQGGFSIWGDKTPESGGYAAFANTRVLEGARESLDDVLGLIRTAWEEPAALESETGTS